MTLSGWLYRIVALVAFFCIGMLIGNYFEDQKYKEFQQVEINYLRKQNELNEKAHQRALDSIVKIQVMQADSTKYYRLLKINDHKIVKNKTESHERIVFHNLNDSARHSKLAKFYPSYVRP